jgi:hypothetical protein
MTLYVTSVEDVDLYNNTVTLPTYEGTIAANGSSAADGSKVYYIVTDASTPEAARLWGVNHAPALAYAAGTVYAQKVTQAGNSSATAVGPGSSTIQFQATCNFGHGVSAVIPGAESAFPPKAFNYSAMGRPGRSL